MKSVFNNTRAQWEQENNGLREALRLSQRARLRDVGEQAILFARVVEQRDKAERRVKDLENILANHNLYSYINNT